MRKRKAPSGECNLERGIVEFLQDYAGVVAFTEVLVAGWDGDDVSRWSGEDAKVHTECASKIDAVWGDLTNILSRMGSGKKVWLAGHGLGGSLALLTGYRLAAEEAARIAGIFTFGQP